MLPKMASTSAHAVVVAVSWGSVSVAVSVSPEVSDAAVSTRESVSAVSEVAPLQATKSVRAERERRIRGSGGWGLTVARPCVRPRARMRVDRTWRRSVSVRAGGKVRRPWQGATGLVVLEVTPGGSGEFEEDDIDNLSERFGTHAYTVARGDVVDQALAALPDGGGGPVPRPTRTDVGWLSFHAPTGRSVEWVTERPGAACVQTRSGALHAGEVIALWRGATRADLPATDDPLWTRWAREFADALHLLCGTASVADTAAEPPAIQALARIVRAESN